MNDPWIQAARLSETPRGADEAARLVQQLRRVVEIHRLQDATIMGVPMAALNVKPTTKRESMAACLLAASEDITWRSALDYLRKHPENQEWRMADAAIEHIPYLDRLSF